MVHPIGQAFNASIIDWSSIDIKLKEQRPPNAIFQSEWDGNILNATNPKLA